MIENERERPNADVFCSPSLLKWFITQGEQKEKIEKKFVICNIDIYYLSNIFSCFRDELTERKFISIRTANILFSNLIQASSIYLFI